MSSLWKNEAKQCQESIRICNIHGSITVTEIEKCFWCETFTFEAGVEGAL